MTVRTAVVTAVAGRDAAAAVNTWAKRSDRYWHRASSALLCLGVAQMLGWSSGRQVVCLAIGALFGGGRLSPDVDQCKAWRRTAARLGNPVPLLHHRITHWPGTAVILGVLAGGWTATWGAPEAGWWLGLMVGVTWLGHDLGDVAIGYGGDSGAMIPRGVPLAPWWHHVGLGLGRSGGPLAVAGTVASWIGSVVLLWPG